MRALSRNTRRVTALTLAAALVIAVYLNWQYAGQTLLRRQRTTPSWSRQSQWRQKRRLPSRMRCPQRQRQLGCQQKLWRSAAGQRSKRQRHSLF